MSVTVHDLVRTAHGMSDMAAKHENDMISNELARVAQRLKDLALRIETLGNSKKIGLDKKDLMMISYYRQTEKG